MKIFIFFFFEFWRDSQGLFIFRNFRIVDHWSKVLCCNLFILCIFWIIQKYTIKITRALHVYNVYMSSNDSPTSSVDKCRPDYGFCNIDVVILPRSNTLVRTSSVKSVYVKSFFNLVVIRRRCLLPDEIRSIINRIKLSANRLNDNKYYFLGRLSLAKSWKKRDYP